MMMYILFNDVLVGTTMYVSSEKITNPQIIILSQKPTLRIDIVMQFWFS